MDLRYSASDEEFRAALREWLSATLPELPSEPARELPSADPADACHRRARFIRVGCGPVPADATTCDDGRPLP